MWSRIISRLLTSLVVAWASVTAAFLALHALPGRIQDILAGDLEYPGLREAIAAEWGLDRSLPAQYLDFLLRILQGDFGTSYVLRQPVTEVVGSQLMPTVQLALLGGLLAIVIAVGLALLTAGRGRISRQIASFLELVFASTPVFWLGIVLPSLTLALPTAGLLAQVLREAMEKTLDQPFVTTVRSRGVGELVIRARHVLRHALLPAVTLGGWLIGGLLGGAVITEKVFGRPGLGTVTLGAVLTHDVPVVLAVVLLAAFIHVAASTLLDILYLLIDPRLRAQ
jgi:peptide/nickel transport system permease protein